VITLARALLLAAGLGCAMPGSARASGAPGPLLVEDEVLPALALVHIALPVLVVDLVLLAIDRPLPHALSVPQIAIVGLLLPIATLETVDDAGFERADRDVLKVFAVASLIWFCAHGIYSIAAYDAREKAKKRERADALWRGDAAVRSLTDS
jgi:hypothetical protein